MQNKSEIYRKISEAVRRETTVEERKALLRELNPELKEGSEDWNLAMSAFTGEYLKHIRP